MTLNENMSSYIKMIQKLKQNNIKVTGNCNFCCVLIMSVISICSSAPESLLCTITFVLYAYSTGLHVHIFINFCKMGAK